MKNSDDLVEKMSKYEVALELREPQSKTQNQTLTFSLRLIFWVNFKTKWTELHTAAIQSANTALNWPNSMKIMNTINVFALVINGYLEIMNQFHYRELFII